MHESYSRAVGILSNGTYLESMEIAALGCLATADATGAQAPNSFVKEESVLDVFLARFRLHLHWHKKLEISAHIWHSSILLHVCKHKKTYRDQIFFLSDLSHFQMWIFIKYISDIQTSELHLNTHIRFSLIMMSVFHDGLCWPSSFRTWSMEELHVAAMPAQN